MSQHRTPVRASTLSRFADHICLRAGRAPAPSGRRLSHRFVFAPPSVRVGTLSWYSEGAGLLSGEHRDRGGIRVVLGYGEESYSVQGLDGDYIGCYDSEHESYDYI